MLKDTFGREINYVRVSVTKQCNFRCQYCMPNTPLDAFDQQEYIPLDNTLEFLKVGINNGISKIRITGGEPLLRRDLPDFITRIRDYAKSVDKPVSIVLTTNAFFLEKVAKELKDAGLERINISLDSLKRERILQISKKDALLQVLRGIQEARNLGFGIKLNTVLMRGKNEDEILDLFQFAKDHNISIRFIEYMENVYADSKLHGIKEKEILDCIAMHYSFQKKEERNMGPARLYECQDGYVFGVIAPHNHDFCESCNRIRLTSDGIICPCLYYQDSVDAKEALLSKDPKKLEEVLRKAVYNKPEKNQWDEVMDQEKISARAFYHTGG